MKVIRLYNCGHFTKDCVGPDSTRSFVWSTGLIFANIVTVEYYSIPSWEVLARWPHSSEGRVSKKWSPPIVPFFDRVDLLKNSNRSKIVVPWSSWSSDDGAYTQSTLRTTLDRERQRLYERSRGWAGQGDLQGTLGRPRWPRTDGFWSATVFQQVNSVKKGDDWRRFRTTIGPIKNIDSSGTIWSRPGWLGKINPWWNGRLT